MNKLVNTKAYIHEKTKSVIGEFGLENHGLINLGTVYWNLPIEELYEEIIARNEGVRCQLGPIVVKSGTKTDLLPNDTFIVKESTSENELWWGENNRPFSENNFSALMNRVRAYFQNRDLFVQDCYTGGEPNHTACVRVITEFAWHSLFAQNMLNHPESNEEQRNFIPDFTIIDVPLFQAMPEIDGTQSEAFIILNFEQKLCIIGNSGYAGEIKKVISKLLNYLLPANNILPLACSANVGTNGNSALFIGQSGAGKTALASVPERKLVGLSRHCWGDEGISNLEYGCYSNVYSLSPDDQPEIHSCIKRTGVILENVTYAPDTGKLNFNDNSITDNMRAAYPLHYIDSSISTATTGHPENIFLLSCDATGVLPPVARLTIEQAIYYFISGYSSKIDGFRSDSDKEPEMIFSPCFDAPVMAHNPSRYAEMLKNKILRYKANCWLINTGWTGGPIGIGQRIGLDQTRDIVNAALDGSLTKAKYYVDPVFGFEIPENCKNIPVDLLSPERAWNNSEAYNAKRQYLALCFMNNFNKYANHVESETVKAGPTIMQ